MASSNAWVLPLDDTFSAAVGEFEVAHLVHYPALFSVPGTPYYCNRVLVWQDQILPALDLGAWLRGRASQSNQNLVAVTTYPDPSSDDMCYAGLLLADIPSQLTVDDSQACDLPSAPAGWGSLAISCFRHHDRVVPIIDLQTVFSGVLMNSQ
jgi:chemotaxis signal transduction protein